MFDYVKCDYPLVDCPEQNKRIAVLEFQTKSTPTPALDFYHVREDGTLWWRRGFEGAPQGEWVQNSFSGKLNIVGGDAYLSDTLEFNLFFTDGQLLLWDQESPME